MLQEYRVIFGIFVKKFKRTGSPNSKNVGATSRKRKNWEEKKEQRPNKVDPTQRWWIRILRTFQRRWIDPDPLNSHPKATGAGKWVGSEPTRFGGYIKGYWSGSCHFLELFSLFFFSSSPFSLLTNPNPKSSNSYWKWFVLGLKAS